jgi:hypothetical protein
MTKKAPAKKAAPRKIPKDQSASVKGGFKQGKDPMVKL